MKMNQQYYVICKICKICIRLHIFAYHTYFAYDAYIVQVHLIWSEDAVNTDIAYPASPTSCPLSVGFDRGYNVY